jgi:apolipoprotein N-acyltransferase
MTSTAIRLPKKRKHLTSRSVSIIAALLVDVGLVWLLLFQVPYRPALAEREVFWVGVVATFGAYAVLQQWSLARQTSRGDDFSAALDKFVAATPMIVVAMLEAYWVGVDGLQTLSWRHHAVAVLWSAFALTDFFATDITNQRLKTRQVSVGESSS